MANRKEEGHEQGRLHDYSTDAHRDVILDSLGEGVFTVDLDWRIMSFNRAAEEMTGIRREDAVGRPCREVFRANICESACALRSALEIEGPATGPVAYIIDVDGNQIPIRISATPLRSEDGRIIGGVETFQDLRQVEELRRKLESTYSFQDIIGRSAAMNRLFEVLPMVAANDSNVLIEGASGTGKELVARAIHNLSTRRRMPLVAVNCGALQDTLLESELFGHKAGAFTGAKTSRPGPQTAAAGGGPKQGPKSPQKPPPPPPRPRAPPPPAEGGTLFLDEISTISPAMQVRLLRVLQERTYEPVGSDVPVHADVRIIAATNEDLGEQVRSGAFREDLYYRIHVIHLNIPSLRERREDIPLLADHFVARFNRLQDKDVAGISEGALTALMDHDYPGNVRELENAIELAFVFTREGLIEAAHLPPAIRQGADASEGEGSGLGLKAMEARMVTKALEKHAGNRARAARELGIDPSTLYRKIKSLGIRAPRRDGRRRNR